MERSNAIRDLGNVRDLESKRIILMPANANLVENASDERVLVVVVIETALRRKMSNNSPPENMLTVPP